MIVGSGAGGARRGRAAGAGLDVIVVEAGDYYDDQDFEGSSWARSHALHGRAVGDHDQSVALLAGSCLGGGTVVNYTTSFRTPDDVRAEWATQGVPAFTTEAYTARLDAVCDRLGVNQEYDDPRPASRSSTTAARTRVAHRRDAPRGPPVRQGRKVSATAASAAASAPSSRSSRHGLRDPNRTGRGSDQHQGRTGDRRGGAARGIRQQPARALTIRSRAVIVSCEAIHTPALLKRSGLQNPNIGRHLKLPTRERRVRVFDENLRSWEA